MARYYSHRGSGCQELVDLTQLVEFMRKSHDDEGKLFVNNLSWLEVDYNLRTGNVKLASTEKRSWIIPFFSEDTFQSIIRPVCEAIRVLSRFELLLVLGEYDPEIHQLVQKRHVDSDGNVVNLMDDGVENTLKRVIKLVQLPSEHGVLGIFGTANRVNKTQSPVMYELLKSIDVESIHSLNDLLGVIDVLKSGSSMVYTKH